MERKALSVLSLVFLFSILIIGTASAEVTIRGTVYDAGNIKAEGITVTVNCDSETSQTAESKGDGTYDVVFTETDYCNVYSASVETPYHVNAIHFPDGSADPIITLNGANPQIINQGDLYTELGATANDDIDGDLSLDISIDSTTVDINTLGSYNVNYSVTDSNENTVTVIRVVNVVDLTAPVVSLITPENSSTWPSSTVTFTYNVTDTNSISNCSLIINGVVDQTTNPITRNISQTFIKSLSNANYNWGVSCTDLSNNQGNSSIFSLTVSYTAPVTHSGGGGTSGKGGMCTTNWTCSDWNDCVNGTQTRTCSYPSNFCEPPISKPAETQTCTVKIIEEEKEEKTTSSTGFFTGAVTGFVNFAKTGLGMGLLIGLLVIGGSVVFFSVRKRKKKVAEN